MHILIAYGGVIPAKTYGGIQRSIWYLGKELVDRGHRVTFLVGKGSVCPFARVIFNDPTRTIARQIPDNVTIAHICASDKQSKGELHIPYIVNVRGNYNDRRELDVNTVFISKDHAARFGSDVYVYNGMNWDDYGPVRLDNARRYFHFLGKAAWRAKNIRGAIDVIRKTRGEKLYVLGGYRLNFNMGFRFTLSPRIRFKGMVGGERKNHLLNGSKGLLLPVRWHEPFGNAMIESLYFGCPVFGTPYGSQPELIHPDVGYLSADSDDLARAIQNAGQYSRKRCHEYARDEFNASKTADGYLRIYEKVLGGQNLHARPPQLLTVQDQKYLPWV